MSAASSFASGLRWVALGRLSAQLASWVGTIYVMRTLAPQDYGLAAICSMVLAITAMVAEVGIGAGIVQAERLEHAQRRSVFGAALLFGLLGALSVVLAAPLLGWFFRAPEAVPLIRVAALQLLLTPLAVMPEAHMLRELRFRSTSLVDFVVALAAAGGTVALAWQGAGVWALVLGPMTGSAARVLMLNLMAPQRLLPSFDLRPARGLIGFGVKVAMTRIASFVFGQSDVLVAGRVLSKSALGEYSVAINLAMLPISKVMGIVNQVAYPTVARLSREGTAMQPVLLGGLRLLAYAVIPVLWGLAAVAPWLIPALIGQNWEGAVAPLQIVCLVLPLRLLSVLLSSVVQGMGHAGLDVRNALTGVLLLPICFAVGAPFGATGLACAWLVGLPLMMAINLHRARPVTGIGLMDALTALSKPLALSAAMFALVYLTAKLSIAQLGAWPMLSLAVAAGAVSYLTMLWIFDRHSAMQLLKLLRPQ